MHGVKIVQIEAAKTKSEICREVLQDLPEWFGIEDANKSYMDGVKNKPMFAAYHQHELLGFYSIEEENQYTLNMYVLGVKKRYHKAGIGHALQKAVETYAIAHKYRFLIVLTLAAKHPDQHYKLTRNFYKKEGFYPIYQNDTIWDQKNPAQIYLKPIN